MYDHLLFDADGTIYDFMASEEFALKNLFNDAHLKIDADLLHSYHEINHALWSDLEKGLVSLETLKIERFNKFFISQEVDFDPNQASRLYLYYLSLSHHIYDDTIDVLTKIHEHKIPMSMITNGASNVQRGRLKATGTSHLFSFIAIGEELGVLKPEAEFFHKTVHHIRELGLPVENPLVIGDSISSDIDGAKNANIDSCWVDRYRMEKPLVQNYAYHITQLNQILDILSIS